MREELGSVPEMQAARQAALDQEHEEVRRSARRARVYRDELLARGVPRMEVSSFYGLWAIMENERLRIEREEEQGDW